MLRGSLRSPRSRWIAASSAVLALVAIPIAPAYAGGCGTTVVEQLGGPEIAGIVPEGRATADESQLLCGGSTVLTVEVKNVNVPDGTVLEVSLDFTPLGTITISGMGGAAAFDLGRFAVSNDEVRVSSGGSVLLVGAFFR
jgi:hypothetical protein